MHPLQVGEPFICNDRRVNGHWNIQEQNHHINYLELLAAWFELKL